MIIYECDDAIVSWTLTLKNQINIEPSYLHNKYINYRQLLQSIDLLESSFQYWYKSFIKQNLQNKIDSYRIVYSLKPSIVCYMPKLLLYSNISHPIVEDSYSVFCPFTRWMSSNTISVDDSTSVSLLSCEDNGSFFMINHTDKIIFPENINQSNNTFLGFFFTVMSYSNYKLHNLNEYKKIGTFFGLL
jgi:hypothetical protein